MKAVLVNLMILHGETKVHQAHGRNSMKVQTSLVYTDPMMHIAHHIMMVIQVLRLVHLIFTIFLVRIICVCMMHLPLELKTELTMVSGWIKEESLPEIIF